MAILVFTLLILTMLIVASFYFSKLNIKEVQKATEQDRRVNGFLLAPFLITVINLFLLNPSSPVESLIAVLLLWLNIIFFFLVLIKHHGASRAILLATLLSQVILLIVYLTQSEYLNNLLLILALMAAAALVYKRLKINDWIWISLLLIMAGLDAIFVWLIPVVPQAEAQVRPLIFSLLVKVGDISLGAGDVVFLLLAILILTKRFSQKVVIWSALILSLSLPIALLIQKYIPGSTTSFPFLIVLVPIFLVSLWITRLNVGRGTKNSIIN
ncbi:MAG: hypothetical protein ABIB97_01815 [Patescibacteria group bacterium]